MLDLVATVAMPEYVHFVTLTTADKNLPPSGRELKKWMRALWERMRRAWPESSAIWRIENEERKSGDYKGCVAPHIHMLAFNVPKSALPKDDNKHYSGWFHEAWESITGHHDYYPDDHQHDLRTDHKLIVGTKGLMYYTAKYCAKSSHEEDTLVSLPYLHAGRYWGVFNKSFLPLFPCIRIERNMPDTAFFDVRRAFKRKLGVKARNGRYSGFTLYTDNAMQWGMYLYHLVEMCQK